MPEISEALTQAGKQGAGVNCGISQPGETVA
jgi:hypothetical protein